MSSIIRTYLFSHHHIKRTRSFLYAASQTHQNRTQARGQGRVRRHQTKEGAAIHPFFSKEQINQTFRSSTYRSPTTTTTTASSTPIEPSTGMPPKRNQDTSTTAATSPSLPPGTTENRVKLSGVEVEIKFRIPDAASFDVLTQLLIPCFHQAHEQENLFFDGAKKELSSQKVILRLRFYNGNKKAVLTCKGRQVLTDGIGVADEEEEEINPTLARTFIDNPDGLLSLENSPLMTKLKEQYTLDKGLVSLGGFCNLRQEFKWKGHLLEIDQTSYPWGTVHEIECETSTPEELKKELEMFLKEHGIPYSYSTRSKFANFIHKTLE